MQRHAFTSPFALSHEVTHAPVSAIELFPCPPQSSLVSIHQTAFDAHVSHSTSTTLPTQSVPSHPLTHQQPLSSPVQLLSPSPSSPLSFLEYREGAPTTTEEFDTPEFFQYSKEKYESAKSGVKRRKRRGDNDGILLDGQGGIIGPGGGTEEGEDDENCSAISHAEFRRQVHIQSEQKRRAEIKDGFEELRRQLPFAYNGRKMSKATLLQKTVNHIKQMRSRESFLLEEINRLNQTVLYLNTQLENEKKMGQIYRQRQTLDKIYALGL